MVLWDEKNAEIKSIKISSLWKSLKVQSHSTTQSQTQFGISHRPTSRISIWEAATPQTLSKFRLWVVIGTGCLLHACYNGSDVFNDLLHHRNACITVKNISLFEIIELRNDFEVNLSFSSVSDWDRREKLDVSAWHSVGRANYCQEFWVEILNIFLRF